MCYRDIGYTSIEYWQGRAEGEEERAYTACVDNGTGLLKLEFDTTMATTEWKK